MTNKVTANYTPEMVEKLKQRYNELGNEGLPQIAEEFGKPIKSIRSKLCTEKVYIASDKTVSRKTGPSKKEILKDLEELDFDTQGFENATKDALHRLLGLISN